MHALQPSLYIVIVSFFSCLVFLVFGILDEFPLLCGVSHPEDDRKKEAVMKEAGHCIDDPQDRV